MIKKTVLVGRNNCPKIVLNNSKNSIFYSNIKVEEEICSVNLCDMGVENPMCIDMLMLSQMYYIAHLQYSQANIDKDKYKDLFMGMFCKQGDGILDYSYRLINDDKLFKINLVLNQKQADEIAKDRNVEKQYIYIWSFDSKEGGNYTEIIGSFESILTPWFMAHRAGIFLQLKRITNYLGISDDIMDNEIETRKNNGGENFWTGVRFSMYGIAALLNCIEQQREDAKARCLSCNLVKETSDIIKYFGNEYICVSCISKWKNKY